MLIHADFSQAVIIKPEDYHWVKSPRGEVDRVMLDRIGDEVARATSLVKYAPHTTFLNIDIIMVKKSSYFQAYLLKIKISTTPLDGIYAVPISQYTNRRVKKVH